MTKRFMDAEAILKQARPLTHQQAHEIQPYGHLVKLPIALAESACKESVENLNQVLADTMTLRDLYKKHHWQVAGPTFYQLHLLFDKHYDEQSELVDTIAERIQLLGGVSVAMASDVAETTLIPPPPKGRAAPRKLATMARTTSSSATSSAATSCRSGSSPSTSSRCRWCTRHQESSVGESVTDNLAKNRFELDVDGDTAFLVYKRSSRGCVRKGLFCSRTWRPRP